MARVVYGFNGGGLWVLILILRLMCFDFCYNFLG